MGYPRRRVHAIGRGYQGSMHPLATVARRFDLDVQTTRDLVGYDDDNGLIEATEGRFVVKWAPRGASRVRIDAQVAALDHLAVAVPELRVPRVHRNRHGDAVIDYEGRWARVLAFVPGRPLGELGATEAFDGPVGDLLGRLSAGLRGFGHPGCHQPLSWDTRTVLVKAAELGAVERRDRRLLDQVLLEIEDGMPGLCRLPEQVTHHDGHDQNLMVDDHGRLGLIDFGDLVHSWRAAELAVGMSYRLADRDDPLGAAASMAAAFHRHAPLAEGEVAAIPLLVGARLTMSLIHSAVARARTPDNAYVSESEPVMRALLRWWLATHPDAWVEAMRRGIGLEPGRMPRSTAAAVGARADHLGPSLSVHYPARPLKIVRGVAAHLYGEDGRRYVDLVNNVAHVGHGHPAVVRAAGRQQARLNTNTRYLHDALLDYAARLASLFPDPLSVCLFTCSGSEANELALRMARAHTGRTDVLTLEGAYHGNTSALVDISPYKLDGAGGRARPEHLHVAWTPDPYRGRRPGPGGGEAYAAQVGQVAEGALARGGVAAFFVEPVLGCAGQIVPPDGYLRGAFEAVRATGGLCVADEVQVGFGRVGTHMWAFEASGVVPDIVTLGKPMGNGHPLAAVVTTPAIAASFANGMEYFNTFGGNPVSCAVGQAVLDVIEGEGLMERSRVLGEGLLRDLRDVGARHACVGDVRGRGLFVGIELVGDAHARDPDPATARRVSTALRDAGFLVSVDGPDHNVLKLKPPVVVEERDLTGFVRALDAALEGLSRNPATA